MTCLRKEYVDVLHFREILKHIGEIKTEAATYISEIENVFRASSLLSLGTRSSGKATRFSHREDVNTTKNNHGPSRKKQFCRMNCLLQSFIFLPHRARHDSLRCEKDLSFYAVALNSNCKFNVE